MQSLRYSHVKYESSCAFKLTNEAKGKLLLPKWSNQTVVAICKYPSGIKEARKVLRNSHFKRIYLDCHANRDSPGSRSQYAYF